MNIVDPSAVVTKNFQMTKSELKDGHTLSGIKLAETPQTITLQLKKTKVTIPQGDIESTKPSTLSLMPDGLLQTLKPDEIRALFAYLQSDSQVELPK